MNHLKRLEKLIQRKEISDEGGYGNFSKNIILHGRAILCKNAKGYKNISKTRTHNVELKNNFLYWENNNSKSWLYEFENNEKAKEWWVKNFPSLSIWNIIKQ